MSADITPCIKIALISNFRTPGAVVHDDADRRDVAHHCGGHLTHSHAKTAVAHQRNRCTMRRRHLGAKRRGIGESDHAAIERRQQRRRFVTRQLVGCLKPCSAGIQRKNRIARRRLAQLCVDHVGMQRRLRACTGGFALCPQRRAFPEILFVALAPRRGVCSNRRHQCRQPVDHRTGIGGHRQRGGEITAQRSGIHIDLNDFRAGRDVGVLVERGVETEPGAQCDDQISFAGQLAGDRIAARADAAGMQRKIHRQDIGMSGGTGHRNLQFFSECGELAAGARPFDAGAGMKHRALRGENHFADFRQRRRIGRRRTAGRRRMHRHLHIDVVVEQIARNVHHHRTAAAGVGDAEGFEDEFRNAFRTRHRHHPLGHRQEQRVLINLLERVAAEMFGGCQTGDRHHRRIGKLCLRQPQHHVCRAWPGLTADEHTRRLRHPPVGVGHVHAAVFVAHADVFNVFRIVQRVIHFKRARPHQAEHLGHTGGAQRLDGSNTAAHFFCAHDLLLTIPDYPFL